MVRNVVVIRMCVACRQRAAVDELLRVVAADNPEGDGQRLVPDPARLARGRGAHVHVSRHCLEKAVQRRVFARALRVAGPIDVSELQTYIKSLSALWIFDGVDAMSTPATELQVDQMSSR